MKITHYNEKPLITTNLNLETYNFLNFIRHNVPSRYTIGYGVALSLLIIDYLSRYSLDKLKEEKINLSQIRVKDRFKTKENKIKLIYVVRGEISEEHFILVNYLKYLYKISIAEIVRRLISGFRKMYKENKDIEDMMTNLNRIFKEYKNGKC